MSKNVSFALNTVFPINIGTIHLVGIGGIGMSGMAEVLNALGYKVQGSDVARNYVVERLEDSGIKVILGHSEQNVENCSVVVKSTAISDDNPEIVHAKELGIPVIRRSEMLAELMRFKNSISISGTHGKTTTTSLVAFLLENAGLDPTVINGGIINHKNTNAYMGGGPYLVAEADESDGTFIRVPSYVGIVTNIDPEHLDYYKTFENAIAAYRTFITNLPFYGFGVLCYDHHIVRQLGMSIKERNIVSYGIEYIGADLRAANIKTSIDGCIFDVILSPHYTQRRGLSFDSIQEIKLGLNGLHNISNTLAAIAVGLELGIEANVIRGAFRSFKGVQRRFTKVAEVNGFTVIDDYAHHPVEIKATLSTARDVASLSNGKVIAVVQPHRYSRVQELMTEFGEAFQDADTVFVTDIYAAGELPRPGVTAQEMTKHIKALSCEDVYHCAQESELVPKIKRLAKSGDIVIFLGAGNITKWAYALPKELSK
jgi:UDP-N-acetylmuramate--alanine ligase